jgi:hypothetical protein
LLISTAVSSSLDERLNVILFGSGDEEGGSLLFLRVCASEYFWRRDKKYTYNLKEKKIKYT